ncbi:isoprenylcysteine carboxyl methyltransferase family protein [Bacillus salitolerans]|uniref:Isoprenylcysteine carboxyl methyltransferase family protein n=1 Tax=Bacillus salitolerans TaxID=1437434 RepID=A0ABW4LTJ9_9BACI
MLFYLFFSYILLQRVFELKIAKSNEMWMKERGAIEYGRQHYPIIVVLHVAFLFFFFIEVLAFERKLSSLWLFLLFLFIVTQGLRIWVLASLGKFWNTKIIILPNATIVNKGPYQYLRHPNYVIVVLEILIIPLMFQAYWTAIFFSLLNLWMLSIRIKVEEEALIQETNYTEQFEKVSRFSPFRMKRT